MPHKVSQKFAVEAVLPNARLTQRAPAVASPTTEKGLFHNATKLPLPPAQCRSMSRLAQD